MNAAIILVPQSEKYAEVSSLGQRRDFRCLQLLTRYEEMTRKVLTKEMFVCEVEKPDPKDFPDDRYDFETHMQEYEAAKKKCWFEGFEFPPTRKEVFCVTAAEIFIGNAYINYTTDTVHDMLYHLDFYNRTAATPIRITHTDSFVEALINDKN